MVHGCYVDGTWMVRGLYVDGTWMVRGFGPDPVNKGPMRILRTFADALHSKGHGGSSMSGALMLSPMDSSGGPLGTCVVCIAGSLEFYIFIIF